MFHEEQSIYYDTSMVVNDLVLFYMRNDVKIAIVVMIEH